ncbi:MAG: DUF2141 domain-containing protein [Sphingomicrobium sp.]
MSEKIMLNLRTLLVLASLTGAASTADAAIAGADAPACENGKPAVLVHVSGFKRASGTVKLALYRSEGYLAKRAKLRKVVVPVRSAAALDICIAVPAPGRYAITVHHDLNGNGDKDGSDGGGYSNNPRLTIMNLRPPFSRTAVDVGSEPRRIGVVLQYRKGLSIGPVNG